MDKQIGFLIIHGFGGNPEEILPFKTYLEGKGYEVMCPELKGHTGRRQDLSQVTYSDWVKSAETDLIKLKIKCDKTVVLGFSMGGLIALNLVSRHQVHGVATLNTPIYYWDLPRILGNLYDDLKSGKTTYIRRYLSSAFQYPLAALLNFNLLLNKTKKDLNLIACPIFIAQGLLDDTVQCRSADYIDRSVSSAVKRKQFYPNANHLICHSPDKEALFQDVLLFFEQ